MTLSRLLTARARAKAREIADAHVPNGTRLYDEVFMSRAALENLLALAYVAGSSDGGPQP